MSDLQEFLARKKLLRGADVMDLLSISKSTLFRLLRERHLTRVRLPGGGVRITARSVARCLDEWEEGTNGNA